MPYRALEGMHEQGVEKGGLREGTSPGAFGRPQGISHVGGKGRSSKPVIQREKLTTVIYLALFFQWKSYEKKRFFVDGGKNKKLRGTSNPIGKGKKTHLTFTPGRKETS